MLQEFKIIVVAMGKGVKVPVKEAEKVRQRLLRKGALDNAFVVERDSKHVIFPVIEERLEGEFEVVAADFKKHEKRKSFEECLRELLCRAEIKFIKRSYDVIGDIAIIEALPELEEGEIVARCLIDTHRNIRTVYQKRGRVRGSERVRELQFLFGEEKSETLHREHGLSLLLDVKKVYFSPRLSYERQRILEQVKDGEVIVDLFAGVGPFSILLAKYRDVKVYAIDSNPHAFRYLERNIGMNKVGWKVVPLFGDCSKVAPRRTATRVIMNLPKSSDEFLGLAFDVVEKGVIHFYSISPEEDLYGSKVKFIEKTAREKGRKVKILGRRIVRPYSPYNYHIAIDIWVE